MDPNALAQHSAQTTRTQRPGAWKRPPPLAQHLLYQAWVVQPDNRPCLGSSILFEVNHHRESRMRENRQSGLEGGGTEINRSFLPLSVVITLRVMSLGAPRAHAARKAPEVQPPERNARFEA